MSNIFGTHFNTLIKKFLLLFANIALWRFCVWCFMCLIIVIIWRFPWKTAGGNQLPIFVPKYWSWACSLLGPLFFGVVYFIGITVYGWYVSFYAHFMTNIRYLIWVAAFELIWPTNLNWHRLLVNKGIV